MNNKNNLFIRFDDRWHKFSDVPGDGNCMYHCLTKCPATQLTEVTEIRQALVDMMQSPSESLLNFFLEYHKQEEDPEPSLEKWKRDVMRDTEWGSNFESALFGAFYGVNVCIVTNDPDEGMQCSDTKTLLEMYEVDHDKFIPKEAPSFYLYLHKHLQPKLPTQEPNHFAILTPIQQDPPPGSVLYDRNCKKISDRTRRRMPSREPSSRSSMNLQQQQQRRQSINSGHGNTSEASKYDKPRSQHQADTAAAKDGESGLERRASMSSSRPTETTRQRQIRVQEQTPQEQRSCRFSSETEKIESATKRKIQRRLSQTQTSPQGQLPANHSEGTQQRRKSMTMSVTTHSFHAADRERPQPHHHQQRQLGQVKTAHSFHGETARNEQRKKPQQQQQQQQQQRLEDRTKQRQLHQETQSLEGERRVATTPSLKSSKSFGPQTRNEGPVDARKPRRKSTHQIALTSNPIAFSDDDMDCINDGSRQRNVNADRRAGGNRRKDSMNMTSNPIVYSEDDMDDIDSDDFLSDQTDDDDEIIFSSMETTSKHSSDRRVVPVGRHSTRRGSMSNTNSAVPFSEGGYDPRPARVREVPSRHDRGTEQSVTSNSMGFSDDEPDLLLDLSRNDKSFNSRRTSRVSQLRPNKAGHDQMSAKQQEWEGEPERSVGRRPKEGATLSAKQRPKQKRTQESSASASGFSTRSPTVSFGPDGTQPLSRPGNRRHRRALNGGSRDSSIDDTFEDQYNNGGRVPRLGQGGVVLDAKKRMSSEERFWGDGEPSQGRAHPGATNGQLDEFESRLTQQLDELQSKLERHRSKKGSHNPNGEKRTEQGQRRSHSVDTFQSSNTSHSRDSGVTDSSAGTIRKKRPSVASGTLHSNNPQQQQHASRISRQDQRFAEPARKISEVEDSKSSRSAEVDHTGGNHRQGTRDNRDYRIATGAEPGARPVGDRRVASGRSSLEGSAQYGDEQPGRRLKNVDSSNAVKKRQIRGKAAQPMPKSGANGRSNDLEKPMLEPRRVESRRVSYPAPARKISPSFPTSAPKHGNPENTMSVMNRRNGPSNETEPQASMVSGRGPRPFNKPSASRA